MFSQTRKQEFRRGKCRAKRLEPGNKNQSLDEAIAESENTIAERERARGGWRVANLGSKFRS